MTCSEDEPIPVDKECTMCKERKLLSEFEFVNMNNSDDKRASICKSCVDEKRKTDPEFGCGGPPHTNNCLIDKTLSVMYNELDCFLSRVQNGLGVAPEIKEIMLEIIRQDEINQRARDEIKKRMGDG